MQITTAYALTSIRSEESSKLVLKVKEYSHFNISAYAYGFVHQSGQPGHPNLKHKIISRHLALFRQLYVNFTIKTARCKYNCRMRG